MRRLFVLLTLLATGVSARQLASPSFPPLDRWRTAVLTGDFSTLQALYSQSPAPQISDLKKNPISLANEIAFWSTLKSKGLVDLSAEISEQQDPQPNIHVLVLQLTLTYKPGASPQREYVVMAQGWLNQGDKWLLVATQHSIATRLRQPLDQKDIYPADANPSQEIAEALYSAATFRKRVLVVFGGNWCFDCHVLDEAFHSPEIAPTLNKFFLVVHVDIGEMNKNLDIAKKYGVPLDRGVPAVAVLDSDGKLLFSQKRGEFEAPAPWPPKTSSPSSRQP
jgi:thioredoxin family protein